MRIELLAHGCPVLPSVTVGGNEAPTWSTNTRRTGPRLAGCWRCASSRARICAGPTSMAAGRPFPLPVVGARSEWDVPTGEADARRRSGRPACCRGTRVAGPGRVDDVRRLTALRRRAPTADQLVRPLSVALRLYLQRSAAALVTCRKGIVHRHAPHRGRLGLGARRRGGLLLTKVCASSPRAWQVCGSSLVTVAHSRMGLPLPTSNGPTAPCRSG